MTATIGSRDAVLHSNARRIHARRFEADERANRARGD